jgi:Rieske Fe-S protein
MPEHLTPNGSHPLEPTPEDQLEQAIADMQAERRPTMPADSAPEDVEALRMAALLRGTLAADAAPRPAFARDLRARLERDLFAAAPDAPSPAPAPAPTPIRAAQPRGTSRRGLLRGGLAAAGGLAAGVAGGALLGHNLASGTMNPPPNGPLVIDGVWQTVARVAQIAPGTALRFTTAQVVGHLVRYADGSFAAYSAACTHMGCIVAWNGAQQTFDCPCHNGRFDAHGRFLSGTFVYLPLPQMQARVVGDDVQVFVPMPATPTAPTPAPTPGDSGYGHGE